MIRLKKLMVGLLALSMVGIYAWADDIHQAAFKGDLVKVKAILEKNQKLVNARDENDLTPLHYAAYSVKILDTKDKHKGISKPIKFTILYDNYIFTEGTKTDWGFSCLIEGTEKTILFDTGTRSDILFHNIGQLNVDLNKVEQIVISHIHGDHTGGLSSVLDKNHEVSVYLPISFPFEFVRRVETKKAKVISVDEPIEICKDVFLTGEMGDQIKEQSLILNTNKGLIIVTGCSHPGIVNILKRAKKILDKEIYLVFGGFHLRSKSDEEMNQIISQFKAIGVKKCGATHCTGDKQIEMFKKAYGKNYIPMGTGKVLKIPD